MNCVKSVNHSVMQVQEKMLCLHKVKKNNTVFSALSVFIYFGLPRQTHTVFCRADVSFSFFFEFVFSRQNLRSAVNPEAVL